MAPRRKVRPLQKKGKKKGPVKRDCSTSSGSSGSRSGSARSSDDDESSSDGGGSDEDDPRDYKRGGYHPVLPYQLYNSRYRVLSKLGAGAFSTVWLCADEKEIGEAGPELVAMKVCKSKKSVTEQALDEVLLLERLEDNGKHSPHAVQMRGHFWHTGPNGRHKCMVFEVMGENLLALVKHHDYEGLPMPMVQRLARHTLLGLEYIHSRGVIHTDIKLENVLVARHDLEDLLHEARRAHCAFMEQRSGLVAMSKSQKKRAKKKEKKQVTQTKGDGGDSDGEEPAAAKGPEDSPPAAATGKGSGTAPKTDAPAAGGADAGAEMADADQAAAEACGRPVPPVRQRERFKTMTNDQVFAKLADFGNGCRVNKKVTDDIQTRQYRSPEVIMGADWDETADVWSAACMFFELITGDFLFDPRTGDDWSRDEDHLALMIELIGSYPPKEHVLCGKYSREFFTNAGKLKHIKSLKFWSLQKVLEEKYTLPPEEAKDVSDFLMPMLRWEPQKRQGATEALRHKWVQRAEGTVDLPCTAPFAAGVAAVAALQESQEVAAVAESAIGGDNSSPATTGRAEVAVAEASGTCLEEVQLEVAESPTAAKVAPTAPLAEAAESPAEPPPVSEEAAPEREAAAAKGASADTLLANSVGANVEASADADASAQDAAEELLLEEDAERSNGAAAGAKAKKKSQKKKGKK